MGVCCRHRHHRCQPSARIKPPSRCNRNNSNRRFRSQSAPRPLLPCWAGRRRRRRSRSSAPSMTAAGRPYVEAPAGPDFRRTTSRRRRRRCCSCWPPPIGGQQQRAAGRRPDRRLQRKSAWTIAVAASMLGRQQRHSIRRRPPLPVSQTVAVAAVGIYSKSLKDRRRPPLCCTRQTRLGVAQLPGYRLVGDLSSSIRYHICERTEREMFPLFKHRV